MFEKLKWFIFRNFGPSSLKTFVDHVKMIQEQHETDEIAVYAKKEFSYQLFFNDGPYEGGPFTFPTIPERDAFAAGVDFAINTCGVNSQDIDQDQADDLDKMFSRSTVSGGSDTKH